MVSSNQVEDDIHQSFKMPGGVFMTSQDIADLVVWLKREGQEPRRELLLARALRFIAKPNLTSRIIADDNLIKAIADALSWVLSLDSNCQSDDGTCRLQENHVLYTIWFTSQYLATKLTKLCPSKKDVFNECFFWALDTLQRAATMKWKIGDKMLWIMSIIYHFMKFPMYMTAFLHTQGLQHTVEILKVYLRESENVDVAKLEILLLVKIINYACSNEDVEIKDCDYGIVPLYLEYLHTHSNFLRVVCYKPQHREAFFEIIHTIHKLVKEHVPDTDADVSKITEVLLEYRGIHPKIDMAISGITDTFQVLALIELKIKEIEIAKRNCDIKMSQISIENNLNRSEPLLDYLKSIHDYASNNPTPEPSDSGEDNYEAALSDVNNKDAESDNTTEEMEEEFPHTNTKKYCYRPFTVEEKFGQSMGDEDRDEDNNGYYSDKEKVNKNNFKETVSNSTERSKESEDDDQFSPASSPPPSKNRMFTVPLQVTLGNQIIHKDSATVMTQMMTVNTQMIPLGIQHFHQKTTRYSDSDDEREYPNPGTSRRRWRRMSEDEYPPEASSPHSFQYRHAAPQAYSPTDSPQRDEDSTHTDSSGRENSPNQDNSPRLFNETQHISPEAFPTCAEMTDDDHQRYRPTIRVRPSWFLKRNTTGHLPQEDEEEIPQELLEESIPSPPAYDPEQLYAQQYPSNEHISVYPDSSDHSTNEGELMETSMEDQHIEDPEEHEGLPENNTFYRQAMQIIYTLFNGPQQLTERQILAHLIERGYLPESWLEDSERVQEALALIRRFRRPELFDSYH